MLRCSRTFLTASLIKSLKDECDSWSGSASILPRRVVQQDAESCSRRRTGEWLQLPGSATPSLWHPWTPWPPCTPHTPGTLLCPPPGLRHRLLVLGLSGTHSTEFPARSPCREDTKWLLGRQPPATLGHGACDGCPGTCFLLCSLRAATPHQGKLRGGRNHLLLARPAASPGPLLCSSPSPNTSMWYLTGCLCICLPAGRDPPKERPNHHQLRVPVQA